jgi:PmbA protein
MSEKITESVKEVLTHMKKEALQGDVYGVEKKVIAYNFIKGEISGSSEFEDMGLGIRVMKSGRPGFGYTVPGAEKKGVMRALELTRVSEPFNIPLPLPESVPDVPGFDKKVVDEAENGAAFVQQLIDSTSSVKDDIIPVDGALRITAGSRVVGNTEGVFLREMVTAVICMVAALIPGERTSLYATEVRCSRKFDIKFEEVGATAAQKVDSMRQKSSADQDIPVVLSPNAFAQLINFAVIPAFIGENVRKGNSVYQGRLGEKVASDTLSITDDPLTPWGMGSGGFDDEGCKSSRVPVFDGGILKNFLYDLKEGVKSSTKSTGNGVRETFKDPPETMNRNILVRGAGLKRDTLFEGDTIYVDDVMGAHTSNPVSGDFSVVANPAWSVHNGETKGRLDGVMISGNLPEILKSIDLADDYVDTYLDLKRPPMNVPTARLENIAISI